VRRIDTPLRWRAYLGLARIAGAPLRLDDAGGAVALTFDDGPDPESTPRLLDVLAEHGATATFFCVGARVQEHPEIVRRMVAEGHAVGSHSQTHRVGDLPPAAVMADYLAGRRALETALGRPVALFRPPHGWLDLRTARALRRHGMQTRLWSVDPHDYQPGTRSETVTAVVGAAVAGDVVLLHDGLEEGAADAPPRSSTIAALPAAIAALRSRGLDLVVLR
jgi:peptidoglycan/xylan/chitin deacetylase (PgdA/CDA1 family)